VDLDIANATKAGVTGTPTTVVRNNRTGAAEALVGAVPADVIAQKIGRLLAAQSQSSVTTGK
jgi:protein-disulfide isomerase